MADRNRPYLLLTLAGLALPGVTSARAAEASSGLDITSAATYVLGAVFLLIVVLVVMTVKRRLEEQRVREAMAEQAFEMEVMAAFRNQGAGHSLLDFPQEAHPGQEPLPPAMSAGDSPGALPRTAPEPDPADLSAAAATAAAAAPAVRSNLLQQSESQFERADEVAAAALTQLRHSGLIHDTDGYMELNGNPQGAVIIRMKDGRRALLIPYHETEAFTRRNLRRFDLLIFVGRDGKAVVVNSLENVIAERLASRF